MSKSETLEDPMEMSRLLKKHGMRVSRVSHTQWRSAFALFYGKKSDTANIEWREEFRYRREAYARARQLIESGTTRKGIVA
jgi:hypothetical protein